MVGGEGDSVPIFVFVVVYNSVCFTVLVATFATLVPSVVGEDT